jgi:hypothetical protein
VGHDFFCSCGTFFLLGTRTCIWSRSSDNHRPARTVMELRSEPDVFGCQPSRVRPVRRRLPNFPLGRQVVVEGGSLIYNAWTTRKLKLNLE